MDGETMIRSRASDRHDPEDHLDPLARKIVGFDRAQIRVPVDLPERLPEIVGALQTLVAHLSAISQAALQMRHGPKLRTDEPMARASLAAALPLVADSIEQSAHDPGSGGEIYVLVREAKRLRALAARLAEAGNE